MSDDSKLERRHRALIRDLRAARERIAELEKQIADEQGPKMREALQSERRLRSQVEKLNEVIEGQHDLYKEDTTNLQAQNTALKSRNEKLEALNRETYYGYVPPNWQAEARLSGFITAIGVKAEPNTVRVAITPRAAAEKEMTGNGE